jgi:hypothetical protein
MFQNYEPLGFEAGDANLYRYVGNSPTNATDPTGLYQEDIHFYMTYYLAIAAGLPESAAYAISWANQYPDVNPKTEPFSGVDARNRFHFRCGKDGVRRGSDQNLEVVKKGLEAGSWMLFGIGLHALQDSWSHEGFFPDSGHAVAGTLPDLPYRDPQKAMEMAEFTYKTLEAYRKKWYSDRQPVKTFDQIKDALDALLKRDGTLQERINRWRGQIADDFKQRPEFLKDQNDKDWGDTVKCWDGLHGEAAEQVKPPFAK